MIWERCFFTTRDKAYTVEIDLVTGEDRRVAHLTYFGVWRSYRGAVYPFVLNFQGIDYGSYSKDARDQKFFLLGEKLVEGAEYRYEESPEEAYRFVLEKSQNMLMPRR